MRLARSGGAAVSLVLVGVVGLVGLAGLGGLAGCKDKADAKADPAVTAAADQADQDLLARRDALLTSRDKIGEEKSKLEAQINEARQAGGDTSELESQLAKLSTEQDANQDELLELLKRQNETYKAQLESLRGQGGSDKAEIAALSAQLQRREGQLADMEKKIGSMVGQLADIRSDIQKQAENCSAGGGTTTIIQAPKLPSGARYSKKDVEPLLTKTRGLMSKRGITSADLPSGIASLEKEATSAMADGDYSKAFLAATTLHQNVDGMKVDKNFVSSKIARLNRQMKAKKLDDATSKQVLDLFNEVGEKYNDGDFSGANKRLNTIAGLL
jgi:chromosome segregation ATPase